MCAVDPARFSVENIIRLLARYVRYALASDENYAGDPVLGRPCFTNCGNRIGIWWSDAMSGVKPKMIVCFAVAFIGGISYADSMSSASVPSPPHIGKTAIQLVSQIHGTFTNPPTDVPSRGMTGGVLEGNGSVGVVLGGQPDQCSFYFGRNDFWSVLRGRIMPVGSLRFSIPALHGASYYVQENIGPADITGTFGIARYQLALKSWVATQKNLVVVQLENRTAGQLKLSAALCGPWGNIGRPPMRGDNGSTAWLDVSPEVVSATIGNRFRGGAAASFEGRIRLVRVFPLAINPGIPGRVKYKPEYSWLMQRNKGIFVNNRPQDRTSNRTVFNCGHVILPQRRFTISADINAAKLNARNVIFCALTGQRWYRHPPLAADPLGSGRPGNSREFPRQQGAASGLLLYLNHGRLAANLNGTKIIARSTVPLHKWVHICASYTGKSLKLFVNGKRVGQTARFPTAAQVMGPLWMWAATHPGDNAVPFDGCSPKGILACRVLGGAVTDDNGRMNITIPAAQKITFVIAVIDNRDTPNYRRSALGLLRGANKQTLETLWQSHVRWWRSYWSKSFVVIPNKTIQSWWYGSLYLLASCSRTGNVAPGLWGNWITSPFMGWQGDYTLDYNYEAPFWAAFPTNHVSLANPYDAPLLAWMGRGAALAKKIGAHGIVYYCHLTPTPGWSADNFRSSDQKSDALFAAVNCIQRWRYTRNKAYARLVWPFLRGVAAYWDHDLKFVNGHYESRDDAPDETLFGPTDAVNPATTLAFLGLLYPALIDMSRQLHRDAGKRSKWRHILAHLSPLPIVPAASIYKIVHAVGRIAVKGKAVIRISEKGRAWIILRDQLKPHPAVVVTGSTPGMNSMQTVFPAWQIGLESNPKLLNAARNTARFMKIWYDCNDTSSFYPALACIGYNPASILRHLNLLVTHIGYPNFAYHIFCGGVENEATVPTTLCAMFVQSYQRRIHIFPDWPRNENAIFGNLLACGDFLVSSRIHARRIRYVKIISQDGLPLRLENPWPGQEVRYTVDRGRPKIVGGKVIMLSTKRGESLLFWAVKNGHPIHPENN